MTTMILATTTIVWLSAAELPKESQAGSDNLPGTWTLVPYVRLIEAPCRRSPLSAGRTSPPVLGT
jgi:hypothetical protein